MWDIITWCWNSFWGVIGWIVGGLWKLAGWLLSQVWGGVVWVGNWTIDQYFAVIRGVFVAYPLPTLGFAIAGVAAYFFWDKHSKNMSPETLPTFGPVARILIIMVLVPFAAAVVGATNDTATNYIDQSVHQKVEVGRDLKGDVHLTPPESKEPEVAWTDVMVAGIGAAGVVAAAWIGAKHVNKRRRR